MNYSEISTYPDRWSLLPFVCWTGNIARIIRTTALKSITIFIVEVLLLRVFIKISTKRKQHQRKILSVNHLNSTSYRNGSRHKSQLWIVQMSMEIHFIPYFESRWMSKFNVFLSAKCTISYLIQFLQNHLALTQYRGGNVLYHWYSTNTRTTQK